MNLLRAMFLSTLLFGLGFANDDAVPTSATPVKFDFAKQCKVGEHTFVLEKATLFDVIRILKQGIIQETGDRADADLEWVVDYTDGKHLIRFSSYGDMGGRDHDLEGVTIRQINAGENIDKLPFLRSPITFQFGSIGMSFSDLVSALDDAVTPNGAAWYRYTGKRPITVSSGKTLDYDVLGTLRVNVIAGKIAEMQLTHVSAY